MRHIHFKEALAGLMEVTRTENTFKIHLVIAIATIIAALYLGFSAVEWLILILIISSVLAAEAFNTAIEIFADYVDKKHNPSIKIVKDISASAVLITVIASVIVGIILFYPKLLILLK